MLVVLNRWLQSTVLTFGLLFAFLIVLEIQSPRFFGWDDNAAQFCGYYQYNYDSIVNQKSFPWMVWTQYAGQTNLSQSQSGVFFIPAYLATGLSWVFFDSPLWNIDLLIVAHLLFGAWGIIRFLRFWGISPEICHAAALLYATTPFFILVSRSWIIATYSMAYTPWLFLFVERLLRDASKKEIAQYIFLKSIFFFQGNTHIWINLSFIEGLYFLGRWWQKNREKDLVLWRSIFTYLVVQGVHLIIILPQLAINIESVGLSSFRQNKIPLEELLSFRLIGSDALLAQFFYFMPERFSLSSNSILFFGGSFYLFYLIYHKLRHREKWATPHATIVFFLLITLLLSTSCYSLLAWLPPFNILRWPIKFMMIAPFFYAASLAFFAQEGLLKKWFPPLILGFAMIQMIVSCLPAFNHPFSTQRFHEEKNGQIRWPYQGGRVLPIASSDEFCLNSQLLTYNYGLWYQIPTLAGYDQLISEKNFRIGLKIQMTGALDVTQVEGSLSHLKTWGVRYLTGNSNDPEIRKLDLISDLKEIYADQELIVWELLGTSPLISSLDQPDRPISFKATPSCLIIPYDGLSKRLIARFAPQKNFFFRSVQSGVPSGWKLPKINSDETLTLETEGEYDFLELQYLPSNFQKAWLLLSLIMVIFLIPYLWNKNKL